MQNKRSSDPWWKQEDLLAVGGMIAMTVGGYVLALAVSYLDEPGAGHVILGSLYPVIFH